MVAEHGPDDIDSSSGERDYGLFVVLAFAAFAVVERVRDRVAARGGLRSEVAGAEQSAVVPSGSVVVAADSARVSWCGCEAGDAGEPVGTVEHGQVAAGRGEELRGQEHTESGQAQEDRGVFVLAKSGLDLPIHLADLLMQVQDVGGEFRDDAGAHTLAGHGRVLPVRGVDRAGGDPSSVAAALFGQPAGQSGLPDAAQPVRGLVPGQQGHRGFGSGVVERGFQRGEELQQSGSEPVEGSGPVRDQVGAVRGQQPQLSADLVPGPQRLQVPTHPGLVGDDRGVFRVGLPVTAVGTRRVMHGPARDVEQFLLMSHEDADQQRRAAVVQIDRPTHGTAVREPGDRGQQLEQLTLVVGDLPRQQPHTIRVDDDAVMVVLARIDSRPYSRHCLLLSHHRVGPFLMARPHIGVLSGRPVADPLGGARNLSRAASRILATPLLTGWAGPGLRSLIE